MLDHNALIVVADGRSARFYRNRARHGIELHVDGGMTASTSPGLASERPLMAADTPKEDEEAKFARDLARHLNDMVLGHRAEQVAIVADPTTLGTLRQNYHAELKKRIVREVAKRLNDATPEAIATALS